MGAQRPAELGMRRHPAIRVRCPHCGACPGQSCTTPSGRHRLDAPHPSRIDAASEAAA